PAIVAKASEQLGLPPFEGDPLDAAPNTIDTAREALEERGLPVTEENVFLVLSAMVPGKKMEVNEGLRLLMGQPRIDIPLREEASPPPAEAATPSASAAPPVITGPFQTRCTVEEGGRKRTFNVTL